MIMASELKISNKVIFKKEKNKVKNCPISVNQE